MKWAILIGGQHTFTAEADTIDQAAEVFLAEHFPEHAGKYKIRKLYPAPQELRVSVDDLRFRVLPLTQARRVA